MSTYAVYNGTTTPRVKGTAPVAAIVEARDKRAALRAAKAELKSRADANGKGDEYFATLTAEKLDLPIVVGIVDA